MNALQTPTDSCVSAIAHTTHPHLASPTTTIPMPTSRLPYVTAAQPSVGRASFQMASDVACNAERETYVTHRQRSGGKRTAAPSCRRGGPREKRGPWDSASEEERSSREPMLHSAASVNNGTRIGCQKGEAGRALR